MQRVNSLDYLKLLMAVGVVIGHSGLLQEWDTPTAFLIGNGFLRMIVPMFAVMSGFLFHGSMERGRVVPWMTQILVFYIGGMLVYAPFWFGAAGGLSGLPGMMLWGYFHLWYLSGLLLAAVMIVGLRFVGAGVHVMAGLAAVMVLAGVCVQVLLLDGRISVALHYFRNGLTVIFPFMMFGFLWAGLRRPAPPLRRLMPLILLAVALMVIENQLVLSLYGMSVMHEIPASSLLLAPLGFLAVLGLRMPRPSLPVGLIAAAIYLMHVLAMMIVWYVIEGSALMAAAAGILLPAAGALLLARLSDSSQKSLRVSTGCAARHS